MKKITNEQILDRIYDLADANGMKINDFMDKVEDEYGEKMPSIQGLPKEIADELENARKSKKEMRKKERDSKNEKQAAEDIKRFRQLFPQVSADSIPDSVWEEVSKGESLVNAYAVYTVTQNNLNGIADEVNQRNDKRSAKAVSDGSTEPVFSKEAVEKMSGKDIKSNYKGIIKSMKNWRF